MPIDPNIPLQVQVPQVQSPIQAMGHAASLAQMMQDRQLGAERLQAVKLANQEKALEAQEQEAIQRAYGEVGGDITKLPGVLAGKVRQDTVFKLQRSINDTIKSNADKDESLFKADALRGERLRGIYGATRQAFTPQTTLEQKQALYSGAVQQALREGLVKPGELPDVYPGDDAFSHMGNILMTGKVLDEAAIKAREQARLDAEEARKAAEHKATLPGKEAEAQVKVRENAAATLAASADKSKDDYAQAWYGIRAQNPAIAAAFPHPDLWKPKETVAVVRNIGMTPAQQSTADISRLNAENNVSEMELRLRAARGDKDAKAALDARKRDQMAVAAARGAASSSTGEVETLTPDPASQSILAQTGLSMPAFLALTGQASKLPRDAKTRSAAFREAQQFANKRGVDVSTLSSQYQTYNTVLSGNIARMNNTKIMESELQGTIENLQGVVKDQDLKKLRFANIAKIWAGQEVNDPLAQQYALHLYQLRNELAAYGAATQGRSGNNITLGDQRDADLTIRNGIAAGSLAGLATAVTNSTDKMGKVMRRSVDTARKSVWDLFGVGGNYKGSSSGDTSKADPLGIRGGSTDGSKKQDPLGIR